MSDLVETLRARPEEAFQAVAEAKVARWVVRRSTTTLEALNGEVVHRLDGGKKGPWFSLLGQRGMDETFNGHTTPTVVTEAYRAHGWIIVGEVPRGSNGSGDA